MEEEKVETLEKESDSGVTEEQIRAVQVPLTAEERERKFIQELERDVRSKIAQEEAEQARLMAEGKLNLDEHHHHHHHHHHRHHKKKKLSKATKTLIVIGVLLVAGAITLFVIAASVLGKIKHVDKSLGNAAYISRSQESFEIDSTSIPDTLKPEEVSWNNADIDVMRDKNVSNILLIGQDARKGEERARSDSMIICSINKKTKKITLVSLMRDMYVPIPGFSDNRINAAYAFGGMDLLDQVIQQDFGIHIDGNVEVDFEGFVKAMEVVGEIPIELNEEEAEFLNTKKGWVAEAGVSNEGWNLKKGMNLLTPGQALAYSRIRYVGHADYERTERQRKVLTAAFEEVRDLDVFKAIELANKALPNFTTDINNRAILGYIYTVFANGMTMGETHRIPADGKYTGENINGMSVLLPDLAANSEELKTYLYGKTE